jgi:hypothetical protein
MIQSAEVIEVLLKDDIQNYYTIRFRFLSQPGNNDENFNTAIPLNIHVKSIPVPGEIVLIVAAASSFAGNFRLNEGTYYYLSIVNIQSDINYNGVPKSSTVPQSNTQNYSNTTLGIKSSTNQSQPSREFKTFEQTNVNSLQLYEGDIVLEGRYGNSLRFGSTIKNSSLISKQTTWTSGKVGDPIIILSNTKNKSSIQQVFRIEDINKDDSSIYLTSTQKIPLKIAGPQTLTNVKLGPVLNNLVGKQILVNSDRIVLNAKQEEIIISSAKGTVITSKADIIIESSSEITLDAAKINLGFPAIYSAVNGELLETILNSIITAIGTITPTTPGAPAAEVARLALQSIPFKSSKVKL